MNQYPQGLTLIELLISLAIIAVLMTFGMSFWPIFHQRHQVSVVVDEITLAINTARVEALLTGEPLIIKPLSAKLNWSHGLVVVAENEYKLARVIHEWGWLNKGVNVEWHGFQSPHYLRFNNDIRHNSTNGYFIIKSRFEQKKLVVNRLGRVRMIV
jgi:prepilin-type N-terminal cleavage/methylation domain-containing protein